MLSKVGSSSFSIVIVCTFLVTTAPFDVRNISKTNAPVRFILYYLPVLWAFTFTCPFFPMQKTFEKTFFWALYTLFFLR
jgi:hypothetical protein